MVNTFDCDFIFINPKLSLTLQIIHVYACVHMHTCRSACRSDGISEHQNRGGGWP